MKLCQKFNQSMNLLNTNNSIRFRGPRCIVGYNLLFWMRSMATVLYNEQRDDSAMTSRTRHMAYNSNRNLRVRNRIDIDDQLCRLHGVDIEQFDGSVDIKLVLFALLWLWLPRLWPLLQSMPPSVDCTRDVRCRRVHCRWPLCWWTFGAQHRNTPVSFQRGNCLISQARCFHLFFYFVVVNFYASATDRCGGDVMFSRRPSVREWVRPGARPVSVIS